MSHPKLLFALSSGLRSGIVKGGQPLTGFGYPQTPAGMLRSLHPCFFELLKQKFGMTHDLIYSTRQNIAFKYAVSGITKLSG